MTQPLGAGKLRGLERRPNRLSEDRLEDRVLIAERTIAEERWRLLHVDERASAWLLVSSDGDHALLPVPLELGAPRLLRFREVGLGVALELRQDTRSVARNSRPVSMSIPAQPAEAGAALITVASFAIW